MEKWKEGKAGQYIRISVGRQISPTQSHKDTENISDRMKEKETIQPRISRITRILISHIKPQRENQ
jgi:hypothetical protein